MSRRLGRLGEEIAAAELRRRGYRIIERNVSTPAGEIDLVASQGEAIVFVEVKARTKEDFGSPKEAVTLEKQRRLTDLARQWLAAHRLNDAQARFDVVSVRLKPPGRPEVEVIENAFEALE